MRSELKFCFSSLNTFVLDIFRLNMQEAHNMTVGEQINKTCDEDCQVRSLLYLIFITIDKAESQHNSPT